MSLDGYWDAYERTLRRIVDEKPANLAELKAILDSFSSPSSGAAFFPGGADNTLWEALTEADWQITWSQADYLWDARSPSGEYIHYVEGDVYPGRYEQERRYTGGAPS